MWFALFLLSHAVALTRRIDFNYMIDESVSAPNPVLPSTGIPAGTVLTYEFEEIPTGFSGRSTVLWHEMRLYMKASRKIQSVRVNVSIFLCDTSHVSEAQGTMRIEPDLDAIVTLGPSTLLFSGSVGSWIRSARVKVAFLDDVPCVNVSGRARIEGKSREVVSVEVLDYYLSEKHLRTMLDGTEIV